MNIWGSAKDAQSALAIGALTPKIIELMKENGIEFTGHQAVLGMQEASGDRLNEFKRTIALVYGILANRNPFWAFVAVKTHQYPQFISDQKEGKMDMTQFDPYGEIIICGEGKSPPDDITLKVAGMYQTNVEQFKRYVEEDIKRAMPMLEADLEKYKTSE